MTTRRPALRCRSLSKAFDAEPVVQGVDLGVDAGQVLALVGLNGAGKTTLMRLVLRMSRPDRGSVMLFGQDASTAGRDCWARVGHALGTSFAYPELTTRENIWAAARLHGLSRTSAPAAVAATIERFDLGAWADRRASTLSTGNRQRVGLAAAFVHRPRLLVLDEPTSALDPAGVVLLRALIQQVAREGAAVLVSSHHLDEVARVADAVNVIHRGAIVGRLDPEGPDVERAFFAMIHDADRAAMVHDADRVALDRPVRPLGQRP